MHIRQIKENCLYVKNLKRTLDFYHRKLGLILMSHVEGRHIFFRAGSSVLLCFLPEVTRAETKLPPHYAYGPQHLAFEVEAKEYDLWKKRLQDSSIKIVHEQYWKEERYSVYFNDPDGHLLEIVPTGVWE